MTAPATRTVAVPADERTALALGAALASLYVGAAAAVALVAILLFGNTSSDDSTFHSVGDYVLTANGLPYLLALLVLLPALRTLQQRRDGRLGAVGIVFSSIGAVVLLAVLTYDLIIASGTSLGPTYFVASLVTDVGVALFAAGSWRAGLLPRWLLVCWPIAWTLGSMLPFSQYGPLLLAAAYVAMAISLRDRARGAA